MDGDKTLTVREGTQSGDRLRMRGYGVPTLGGRARGDQYVHVKCVLGRHGSYDPLVKWSSIAGVTVPE